MAEKIKILVVHHQPLFSEGLCATIKKSPGSEVIGAAINERELFALLKKRGADLLILDDELPSVNMVQLLQQVKCVAPAIKIIILSDRSFKFIVTNYLSLGVDAHHRKEAEPEAILETVAHLSMHSNIVHPSIINLWLNKVQQKPSGKKMNTLQVEIYELLCQGLMNKEIAAIRNTEIGTVDYHIKNIKAITGCETKAELIAYAFENNIYIPKDKAGAAGRFVSNKI